MSIMEGLLFGIGIAASSVLGGALGADLYLRRRLGILFGRPAIADVRRCRRCSCTDLQACVTEADSACWWVEDDLCSACASRGGP